MLSACTSILAVDFPAFPRSLAKTETFGTGHTTVGLLPACQAQSRAARRECRHGWCLCAGLMDIGAGAFVFAGALTSRPQVLQPVQPRSALHRATRGVLPLCALGKTMLCCCRPCKLAPQASLEFLRLCSQPYQPRRPPPLGTAPEVLLIEWFRLCLGEPCVSPASSLLQGERSLQPALDLLVPPLPAGLARLVCVKSAQYQEHASEYGTHWNFFLTLAVVRGIAALTAAWRASATLAAGLWRRRAWHRPGVANSLLRRQALFCNWLQQAVSTGKDCLCRPC